MFEEIDWIIVPGGPGISREYLEMPLSFLTDNYKFHFYDPLGTYENNSKKDINISELVEQIFSFANEKGLKKFGLISHSFGTYLSIKAYQIKPELIQAMLFLNPMPTRYEEWKMSLNKIINRVPDIFKDKISQLMSKCDDDMGVALFKAIFPFYSNSKHVMLPDIKFNNKMCDYLSSQVEEYNHISSIEKLECPYVCIVGEKDPFYYPDMFPEDNTIVIEGVGHYPSIKTTEKLLCLKKKIMKIA